MTHYKKNLQTWKNNANHNHITKRKTKASFTSVKGAIFMPKIQTEKENKQMNDFNKRNYYALFISIVKNETAKEALSDMGICPDSIKEED